MAKAEFISKDGSLDSLLAKAYGRKPTEAKLDQFCDDARKAAETKAPPFEPEPVLTPEEQRNGIQRASLREMIYRLNGVR